MDETLSYICCDNFIMCITSEVETEGNFFKERYMFKSFFPDFIKIKYVIFEKNFLVTKKFWPCGHVLTP
jgi:hypothetical protein